MKLVSTTTTVPKIQKQQNQNFKKERTSVSQKFVSSKKSYRKNSFLNKIKVEHAQFSHASKNETRFLAIAKKLNKTEDSTFSKVQATLEIKMTKPKENFNVDQDLNVL